MSTLPEQFSAARQSQVEAHIAFFQTCANAAVQNAEKIIALNLSATRASMEKSSAVVRQLLAVQEPRDLLALTTPSQQTFDSLLAYSREFFSIASGSQVALLKQATPIIAPSEPEQPVPPKAPKAAPLSAPEAQTRAPVPKPAPAEPALAKAKPIAKAVGKVVPKAVAAKPVAAPFPVVVKPLVVKPAVVKPLVVKPVVVSTLKAVEAAPPVKAAEPKQLDMLTPKPKKPGKK